MYFKSGQYIAVKKETCKFATIFTKGRDDITTAKASFENHLWLQALKWYTRQGSPVPQTEDNYT